MRPVPDAPRGRRTPVVPLAIIAIVLGLTTFGTYKMLGFMFSAAATSMAASDSTPEMPKDMATPPADAAGGGSGTSMPPGGAMPADAPKTDEPPKGEPEKAAEPPPADATKAPEAPPPPPMQATTPTPKAAAPAPAAKAAPATAPKAATPPKAAPKSQQVLPAPPQQAAPPPLDRWAQLDADLARCGREDVFRKIGCELRTRARYCEGYWGKVPQCPDRLQGGS